MRLKTPRLTAQLIFASSLILSSRAEPQERLPSPEAGPSFWQAASGVAAVNALTWFYNWRLQRWDWANVGTRSWWANLRSGFGWDDDAFGANQAAHPYHGSLYFNAARASGYDFWGSTPYVVAGSLSWELFSENVRPSLNDLINTTLGGIALGEVTYRMSSLLSSARSGAAGREIGAFMVSPISRAQSLIHGMHPGNSFQPPTSSSAAVALGQQRGMGASQEGATGSHPFVGLRFQYGSSFDERISRPYDAFELNLHLSPNGHVVLTHASIAGLLARSHLVRSTGSQLLLGLVQHYDYDDLQQAKASSQSLSGALLYRRSAGTRTHLDLGLHLELVPLAAVSTDYALVRRRDYDIGPGIGGRLSGVLRHEGRELVRLEGRTVWIRSLYAAEADHMMSTARVSAAVPVMRTIGVGGDFSLALRRSSYRDHPAVRREVPQFRAYLTWLPS